MLTDEQKTEMLKLIEQYGEAQYELGVNVGEKNQNNDKNKLLDDYRIVRNELFNFIENIGR
jgi:hypothetical protein